MKLDRAFVAHLAAADAGLHRPADGGARRRPGALDKKAESDLIVDLAPHVEDFVGGLFGIEAELRELQARHDKLAPLYSVKRLFVQRRAVKEIKEEQAGLLDGGVLRRALEPHLGNGTRFPTPVPAFSPGSGGRFAAAVSAWLDDEAAHPAELNAAIQYAAWATLSPAGRQVHWKGLLFKVPHRLDMHHLVPVETVERDGVAMLRLPEHDWRARDGFALTDPGTDLAGALDQANYCIWCHNQGKDSCSTGLKEKDGGFRKTVFGVTLAGCPLDEKISEMNLVATRAATASARWPSSRSTTRSAPRPAIASATTA